MRGQSYNTEDKALALYLSYSVSIPLIFYDPLSLKVIISVCRVRAFTGYDPQTKKSRTMTQPLV